MAKDKNGFVLYTDILHTVSKLTDVKAGKLFKHILKYVNDENPETKDIVIEIAFEPIKQTLKRDLKRYEAMCLKNRENVKKRWDAKDTKSTSVYERIPNDTKHTDSDSDSDKDNDKEKIKIIVEYLNFKTTKDFKTNTKKTESVIIARLNENFTVEDFKKVVDVKTSQWNKDSKMKGFLRPETLFGNKFEGYLNEVTKKPEKKKHQEYEINPDFDPR